MLDRATREKLVIQSLLKQFKEETKNAIKNRFK